MVLCIIFSSLTTRMIQRAASEKERKDHEEFLAQKPALLAEMQKLLDEGKPDDVISRIGKLDGKEISDPEIAKVSKEAKLSSARLRLVEATDPETRIYWLTLIVNLDPQDTSSGIQLKQLKVEVARETLKSATTSRDRRQPLEDLKLAGVATDKEREELDAIRKEAAKVAALKAAEERKAAEETARTQRIQKAFSSWDGSVPKLVRFVKTNMHDPDSFDHVKTTYSDKVDHLIVQMTYRGKNAFGAKVLNEFRATTTLDGEVIEVLKSGAPD